MEGRGREKAGERESGREGRGRRGGQFGVKKRWGSWGYIRGHPFNEYRK